MAAIICTDEILSFDCDFNEDKLLLYYDRFIQKAESYSDYRGKLDNWKIARDIQFGYAEELCKRFDINGSPRFYSLKKNTNLPMHIDHGTQCSLNFLIDESEPAPVKFESGNEYTYKFCLLNTQKKHGVDNVSEDRILFKLSIFDETFEQVKQKVLHTYLTENYGPQKKYSIEKFEIPKYKKQINSKEYEINSSENGYQFVIHRYIGQGYGNFELTKRTLKEFRMEPNPWLWRNMAMTESSLVEYEKLPPVVNVFRVSHPDFSSCISWSLDPKIYERIDIFPFAKNPVHVYNVAAVKKEDIFFMSDRDPCCEVLVLPEDINIIRRMKLPYTEYNYELDL